MFQKGILVWLVVKKLKQVLKALLLGGYSVFCNVKILSKGQTKSNELLQLSHRIEKGLCIKNPRSLWGWSKAWELVSLIENVSSTPTSDVEFGIQTAKGVLNSYLKAKEKSTYQKDLENCAKFKEYLNKKGIEISQSDFGGVFEKSLTDVSFDDAEFSAIQKLFNTRHSVRDFAKSDVSKEKILKAIELANRCPSACNRQPTKIYIIDAQDRINLGYKNEYNANKYIILTGCISAFKISEQNDWLVSPSIFAAFLTLSLHSLGIGSCVIRKDLVNQKKYNSAIRSFCNIPKNEQIVLELAIGNYNDNFFVPKSNRKNSLEIARFI